MFTKEIQTDNHLIQNFYIIGLDSNYIFSDNLYKEPLSKNIEPNIISKFPKLSYSYNNIPDSLILKHCFPTGFFPIEITDNKKNTTCNFIFTLDNILFNNINKNKFEKIYFTCFEFYESLFDYGILYKKKLDSINKNNNELEINDNLKKIFIPKIICIASVLPFPNEFSKILSSIYQKYIFEKAKVNYPLEKLIENLVMKIPIPLYGQFINYINFNEKIILFRNPINKIQNNSIELSLLFTYFNIENILKILKCILLEIPLLFFSKDKYKLTNIVEGLLSLIFPFNYIYPFISILPSNCYSIIETFKSYILGINEEYDIRFFKNNNLEIDEKSIIIVDIDKSNINVIEPQSNEMQSILLEDLGNEEKKNNDNSLFSNIEFPSHYKKKIINSLSSYIKKVNNIKEEKNTFNYSIRDKILYFITSIIIDYATFIKYDQFNLKVFDSKFYSKKHGSIKIESIFKIDDYIYQFSKEDQSFYERFLRTKLFLNFIINKIYPKTYEDKLKILFFDEKITSKKNKKFFTKNIKTIFLNSDFSIKNNELKISIPKNFSLEEKEYLLKTDNKNKILDYFQIISFNNENKVNIEYNIFPKLLYDNSFFGKPYSQIFISNKIEQKENLFESQNKKFQSILNDQKYLNIYYNNNYDLNLINQSSINKLKKYNCVDLTWLLVLSSSLWYCELKEREIRFNKIYDIIEKLEYIDEEIFNFIFLSIITYGSDAEVIKFYEFLLQIKGFRTYLIYSLLCDKLTKVFNAKYIQKTKSQSIRVTLLMRESAMNEENDNILKEKYIFRKRSLIPRINKDNNDNEKNKEERIQFDTEIFCEKCGNLFKINYNNLIFSDIKNEIDLKCNLCGEIYNNSKLKINVLIPKNNEDVKIDNFELYSANKLLNQSKEFILPLIDYKLDIENLKKKYKHLFYNYIFYFTLRNLSYDFIIPYANSENIEIENESESESDEKEFENLEVCSKVIQIFIEKTTKNENGRTLTNIDNNYSPLNENIDDKHIFFSNSNLDNK